MVALFITLDDTIDWKVECIVRHRILHGRNSSWYHSWDLT